MSQSPFVWVVTPVFNGERYLAECIDSVLAQSYENWQYVIVDNCSTDRTPEIARAYAARDERIHLERYSGFLPIIPNWNRAMRLLPSGAIYCKVLHADDTLFPHCLQRMVEVAERHQSVAIVTSYILLGDEVRHQGVQYPAEVIDGRHVCRSTLLGRWYLFGSPSSLLLRASDVRARSAFYNEQNYHADTEVCFDLLRDADLGFVHEILTRTRIHPEAMAPFTARIGTSHHGWLAIHLKYGPQFLNSREHYLRLMYRLKEYAVFLMKAAVKLRFRDPTFREHHLDTIRFLLRAAGLA